MEKYEVDEAVAIIAKWTDTANTRLIYLANVYEDENEDEPESKFTLADRVESLSLFRESASDYDSRRVRDIGTFLRARADYIERLIDNAEKADR